VARREDTRAALGARVGPAREPNALVCADIGPLDRLTAGGAG
jgi:hypothetical protein